MKIDSIIKVLDQYVLVHGTDIADSTDVAQKIIQALVNDKKADDLARKTRMDEFEETRLSEPPGEWKPLKGHVGPGGWTTL